MRLYYFAARIANPIFLFFIRIYSKVSRPRVRAMIENHKGEILLVQSVWGMREWELPGGAARGRETDEAAAWRELYEETAILADEVFRKIKVLTVPFPARIFYVRLKKNQRAAITRPFEIKAIGWFTPTRLPVDTAPYVQALLHDEGH
jgi:8-oxo-dGTP pyrophosphatase MutT (NUDIX family)